MFLRCVPHLFAPDLEKIVRFYALILGWEVADEFVPGASQQREWVSLRPGADFDAFIMYGRREGFVPVSRERADVYPWIYVEAVEPLHEKVTARGGNPSVLFETNYGAQEFTLVDPVGYLLTFSQWPSAGY